MKLKLLDRDFTLELPVSADTVGIMVSGGLDSAILLYLLAKEMQDTGSTATINVFSVPRPTDGFDCNVSTIVDYVNMRLNMNIGMPIVYGKADMHHSVIVYTAYLGILEDHLADCIFLGDTANPDVEMTGVCNTSWPRRLKDYRENVMQPFLTFSKKYVVSVCKEFNLDELAKITHSCTVEKRTRCNKCFQCQERAWAYRCNDYQDPGTI